MLIIKFIERTCLDKDALSYTIGKLININDNNVEIIFDNRLKINLGIYNCVDGIHVIRISPKFHKFEDCVIGARLLGKKAQIVELLSTIIHEIRHMQQYLKYRNKIFYPHKYAKNKIFKRDRNYSNYYSKIEIDARIYENINTADSLELYIKYIENR